MNILITGGAGFIGRTLQDRLYKNNSVVLLDKRRLFFSKEKSVTYIQADVCDQKKMLLIFKEHKFDGIIHLAAVSRVVEAQCNPKECEITNIGGIYSLLNSVEKTRQKPWLIFGSSREVYGEAESLPVKEHAPQKAVNIYAETKIKGESLFLKFSKKHHLNCAIVRFSNVYGNRYDLFGRVIPRFIRSIATGESLIIEGGEQLIDFTHIDDSVDGVLNIIEYLNKHNNIQEDFHLCPGIGWTLFQLIDMIEKATGKKAKNKVNLKRDYDVVKFIGDTTKIRKLLGMKDFIQLEQGIKLSIDEYCYNISKKLL